MATVRGVLRSTLQPSSVACAPSALLAHTTFAAIYARIPMSDRSYAPFVAKPSPVNMIGSGTRVFTPARRSLCVEVFSRVALLKKAAKRPPGVVDADLPVQMHSVGIFGARQAERASSRYWMKRLESAKLQ